MVAALSQARKLPEATSFCPKPASESSVGWATERASSAQPACTMCRGLSVHSSGASSPAVAGCCSSLSLARCTSWQRSAQANAWPSIAVVARVSW